MKKLGLVLMLVCFCFFPFSVWPAASDCDQDRYEYNAGALNVIELRWTADSTDGSFLAVNSDYAINGRVDLVETIPGTRVSLTGSSGIWTLSGSGTNEYYYTLAGGVDPSLAKPDKLKVEFTDATEGTAGSLAVGEWDHGDNDSLGFSTVYVRLSDEVDPDTKLVNHIIHASALPTDNYDIVLRNQSGIDIMGGALANRDTSDAELAQPILNNDYWVIPVSGLLRMEISGNSVNSATGRVRIYYRTK